VLWNPTIQRTVDYSNLDTGYSMPSVGVVSMAPAAAYLRAGFYTNGATVPKPVFTLPLNAKIRFGLFRPTGDSAPDDMSEISTILVRSNISGSAESLGENFNLEPDVEEDLNDEIGTDDYGLDPTNYVNHKLRLIGTIDGISTFTSCVPELVTFTKGARYYACSSTGIWHIIEIEANEPGESFHVKSFEFGAINAGRMS